MPAPRPRSMTAIMCCQHQAARCRPGRVSAAGERCPPAVAPQSRCPDAAKRHHLVAENAGIQPNHPEFQPLAEADGTGHVGSVEIGGKAEGRSSLDLTPAAPGGGDGRSVQRIRQALLPRSNQQQRTARRGLRKSGCPTDRRNCWPMPRLRRRSSAGSTRMQARPARAFPCARGSGRSCRQAR